MRVGHILLASIVVTISGRCDEVFDGNNAGDIGQYCGNFYVCFPVEDSAFCKCRSLREKINTISLYSSILDGWRFICIWKVTRPPAPWMASDEIRELKAARDKIRAQARCSGTDETWTALRAVRNRIKAVIGKAKRVFLNTALSSKRPKEVWRVIHRVIHPSPRPISADSDRLNRYFIKTMDRTLGTLPDEATDLVDLIDSLPEPDRYPFQLRTVSLGEVLKKISLLRSDCSTGADQIPVKYVKQAGDFLTGPLAHIINVCISNSQFPRISPVPKVDNPKRAADYRPVSILPALSKVFERLVLKQLVHYIDEQSLLLPNISGFRKGQSTTAVLLGIRDDLIRAMKRGEVTMMVLGDYSKAYDTVRFKSVLTKMHVMGYSKSFLKWMLNLSL